MSAPRVMIMAGGTGGHVFPALAVARELAGRGAAVTWLGTRAGMEARLVPAAGIAIDYVDVAGLRGKGLGGWLVAPLRLARALTQALSILRRRRPQAVLGMGGFASGPGGVAARLLRRPLVIHEQNAIAGLTNRLSAPLAARVLAAFPGAFGARTAEVTGNPVRAEIAALPAPAERFAGRDGRLRLLVVGGSLGATALNGVLPQAIACMAAAARPQVVHQAGERHAETARAAYAAAGVVAEVKPFLDDMAAVYGWADLVVCRAGALTVSELAAAGLPAILVPFPFAVDDHQTANARQLTDSGAALLAPQAELSAERLAGWLAEFAADAAAGRGRLLAMAEAARVLAHPEATAQVAAICLEEAGREGR
jgi:UDP-N-acetylglucosamine--N-acetylmuramyl-(pentapeptide) pyrophosphoryl-undecaprenol N-acetylglucosamine transferase